MGGSAKPTSAGAVDASAAPGGASALQLRLLVRLPHHVVEHDEHRRVLRIERTAKRLVTAEIAEVFARLRTGIAGVPGFPTLHALLMDVRGGPANNDPAFEAAMRQPVTSLYALFARRAVLVRSAAGALQVNRLARARELDDDNRQRAFFDEAQAVRWLLG